MHPLSIKRSPQLVYKGGYKYQLQQPYFIQTPLRPEKFISNGWVSLDIDGMMMFMPGYAWDGPSGGAPDTPSTMAGSLMHDGGYQLIREGLLQQSAKLVLDKFMSEIMQADGMWTLFARVFYFMVARFGRRYALSKPVKVIRLLTH